MSASIFAVRSASSLRTVSRPFWTSMSPSNTDTGTDFSAGIKPPGSRSPHTARGSRNSGKSPTGHSQARAGADASGDRHGQSVVGGKEPWREGRFQRRMELVVGEMREVRALRTYRARGFDGLRNAHVRRMLLPEERVEHQHLHAL